MSASNLVESAKLEGLCNETTARWFYAWYSRYYDRLQKYFSSPHMRERGLDLAGIGGDMRVLDVGAGTGSLTLQVLSRGVPAANVVMLDQSEGMLEQAKRKPALDGVRKVLGDAQSLPFPDESFDRVTSSGAIYYWPDAVQAMREEYRVLKPGGRALAIGTLQPSAFGIRLIAQTFNRFPTQEQYVHWFSAAGFADVETVHVANPWNESQFAIAIVGTRPADGRPPPPRAKAVARPSPGLIGLALLAVRYVVAMAAFAVIGPIQVLVAAKHFNKAGSSP
jgi:MPBQ/MSBQ methyltransferase